MAFSERGNAKVFIMKKIKDGTIHNGAVWLDGQPVAVNLEPRLKLTARQILQRHVDDQRAYITRLTNRLQRVEDFLKKS